MHAYSVLVYSQKSTAHCVEIIADIYGFYLTGVDGEAELTMLF
jgi:hypothetical protein